MTRQIAVADDWQLQRLIVAVAVSCLYEEATTQIHIKTKAH